MDNPRDTLTRLGLSGIPKTAVDTWYTPNMEAWRMSQCLEFLAYSDITQKEIATRTVIMTNKQGASAIRKFIVSRLKLHISGLTDTSPSIEIYPILNNYINSLDRSEIIDALDSSKSKYDRNPNYAAVGSAEVIRFGLLYHLEKSLAGHFPSAEERNSNLPHLIRYMNGLRPRSDITSSNISYASDDNTPNESFSMEYSSPSKIPSEAFELTAKPTCEECPENSKLPTTEIRKEYPPNNSNRHIRIIDAAVINGLLQSNFGKCRIEGFHLNINGEKVLEKHIQERLATEFGGSHYTVDIGIIDILTPTMVCELKNWENWLKALGQILAYSYYFPDREKRIHFFGPPPNVWKIYSIYTILTQYGIVISCEHY